MELGTSLVLGSQQEMAKVIVRALAEHLNVALQATLPTIRAGLGPLIEKSLNASPEWDSLVGGQLQAELGVAEPDKVVRAIITAVAAAAEVVLIPVVAQGESLSGGLRVSILRTDLSEVLNGAIPGAVIVSSSGFIVPWLSWLLTGGDEILVLDHEFVAGSFAGSRTGLGVMHKGGSWRVPPAYAGVESDNWLVRALRASIPDIEALIRGTVQRSLS